MTMESITPTGAARFAPRSRFRGAAAEPSNAAGALAARFGVGSVQTATTSSLRIAQLAVSRVEARDDGRGRSIPAPVENAYLVALQLRDSLGGRLWKRGALVPSDPFVAGSIVIAHLADEPCLDLRDPFDVLLFHIPQIAFGELAEDHGAPAVSAFDDQVGTADPIVHHLGRALLPWLDGPCSGLFFDHVAFAVHARLASRYGRAEPRQAPRGGLTPWQERAAKEALIANLSEEPSLADVARACGLPLGRFVRAFRQSTGAPPHRWLRAFRVERARELLFASDLTLAQIAYECGFADQSHFTRVFTTAVGATPGAWRRQRRV